MSATVRTLLERATVPRTPLVRGAVGTAPGEPADLAAGEAIYNRARIAAVPNGELAQSRCVRARIEFGDRVVDRVGGAFDNVAGRTGGHEATVLPLRNLVVRRRMPP